MASSSWMKLHSSRTKLSVLHGVQLSTRADAAVFPTNLLLAPVWCVCEGFNLLHAVPRIISFNLVLCLICQFRLHFPYNEFPFRVLLYFPTLLPLCQRKKVLNDWTSIGGRKVRVLLPLLPWGSSAPLWIRRYEVHVEIYNPSAQRYDGEGIALNNGQQCLSPR